MSAAGILAVLALGVGAGVWIRRQRCHHRFGLPTYGYVRCLRCTRCYPIQANPHGEWQIGKVPLALDPPTHPPVHR